MRKLWLLVAAAGAWWWWSMQRPGQLDTRAFPDTRMIAFSGAPLEQAMAAGRCGELTDELTQHEDWTLGVTIAEGGCEGWYSSATYEIHADGTMIYGERGLTRTLELDPIELGLVRDLGRLDCTTRVVPMGYSYTGVFLAPGAPPSLEAGAHIDGATVYGGTLRVMLDRAVARWTEERLWQITPLALDLRAGAYRITLDDHTLEVRRHGRLLEQEPLSDRALVDLVDALITNPQDPGRGNIVVEGNVRTDGLAHPVRRAWGPDYPAWGEPTADVIFRALDNARYEHEHRRSR